MHFWQKEHWDSVGYNHIFSTEYNIMVDFAIVKFALA